MLSITTANGTEFRRYDCIARSLDTRVFLTDSYASWQKGAIEKTNKLIRQYIPKGADFTSFNADDIKNIQYKVNWRPRKKLGFNNPKNVLFNLIL
ncbi:MAG: IS30 family transposase [Bacteroides sp.]|nr:IS30 family transposase [Bacteroides sp.]